MDCHLFPFYRAGSRQQRAIPADAVALTDPQIWFAWWICVLLVLDRKRVTMAEVYVGGRRDPSLTQWLAKQIAESDPSVIRDGGAS